MRNRPILSPYSTFLALPFCPRKAFSNLRRLNALGARGKYGFYEALDFTPPYDGEGAPVCAYFSHHLGMSIVALANAAFGDVFVRRFMSDVRMRAGLELLEERSPTELPLRGEPPRRRERERQPAFRSERGGATDDILSPHVAVLARRSSCRSSLPAAGISSCGAASCRSTSACTTAIRQDAACVCR